LSLQCVAALKTRNTTQTWCYHWDGGARAAQGPGAPSLQARAQPCLLTSVSLTLKLEQREHRVGQGRGLEIPPQPSWLRRRHFLCFQINVENQGRLSGG